MTARWLDGLASAAQARLPTPVWQYFAAGAREGITAAEAVQAWQRIRLLPHVLVDVARVDTGTTLLGQRYRLPVGVAPTSLQRCADPQGELAMARAAAQAEAPHVVASNAGHRFAEIAAVGGPWWLQAYVTTARDDCAAMLDAAVAAGAQAIVLTVDTPGVGTKYQPDDEDFADIDLSWHRCNFPAGTTQGRQGAWARDLVVDDIGWLAERTSLPVVCKGVLRADDARRCADAGAAAVWVSNHGGRQLDRVLSTAAALPPIVDEVGGDVEVYVDGGIRSGLDVLTALALGARAAFVGRLPLFALAAGGEPAVSRMFTEFAEELDEALRLAGCADLAAVDRSLVAQI
jgi:4-hydroxymandelate oxidase